MQTEAPRPDGRHGWKGLRLRPEVMGTKDGLAMAPYIRESRRIKAPPRRLEGLLVAAAGAWALLRWPYLLAFATLACLPARIPVKLGDEDANLLLPLYVVVGALALGLGWSSLSGATTVCASSVRLRSHSRHLSPGPG